MLKNSRQKQNNINKKSIFKIKKNNNKLITLNKEIRLIRLKSQIFKLKLQGQNKLMNN